MLAIPLVCPADREPLVASDSELRCGTCAARFPVEAGVARFLEARDEFYEGRYLYTVGFVPRSEAAHHVWPLWLVNSGYLWAVRRHVPAGSLLVEMGCASGVRYFAKRYRVIGLDLSISSLTRVAELYDTCIQADTTRTIPLPDASVDAIASSYVWEHIPPERKPLALAECARVLRPRGKLVFLYDVENRHPLYRLLRRRDPDLYREILIDREGHQGWQSARENLELFEANGFQVVQARGKDKLLIAPAMYDKVRHWGGWLGAAAGVGERLAHGRKYHVHNACQRVLDETLGRLLPESWARVALVVCEKR